MATAFQTRTTLLTPGVFMRVTRRAIPLALAFLTLLGAGASAQGQKIGYIRSSVILSTARAAAVAATARRGPATSATTCTRTGSRCATRAPARRSRSRRRCRRCSWTARSAPVERVRRRSRAPQLDSALRGRSVRRRRRRRYLMRSSVAASARSFAATIGSARSSDLSARKERRLTTRARTPASSAMSFANAPVAHGARPSLSGV